MAETIIAIVFVFLMATFCAMFMALNYFKDEIRKQNIINREAKNVKKNIKNNKL